LTIDFNRGPSSRRPRPQLTNSADIPTGEIGVAFKTSGVPDRTAIRGPACLDPALLAGVERVYLRDVQTGTTQIVSVLDRSSCGETALGSDQPSGNPDVTQSGQLVFFDSGAGLTGDDSDGVSDVYLYDPATCNLTNLSAGLSAPASDPASSDDGRLVAFETGVDPQIALLDRPRACCPVGARPRPESLGRRQQACSTADVAGVSQVFLVEIAERGERAHPRERDGGAFFAAGAGRAVGGQRRRDAA
jgi:hypothetical protein